MNEQLPVSRREAARAVAACVVATAGLVASGRTHLVRDRVGTTVAFGDGTSAKVYRETVVDVDEVGEPAVLVVAFILRGVSSAAGHAAFRAESLLNTPLFVGFPGFVSKLWLTHDATGAYRGLYQWDGATRASHYARCLWRILALVSVPGSVRYRVLPGADREALLAGTSGCERDLDRWWAPTAARPASDDDYAPLRPAAGQAGWPGFARSRVSRR